MVENKNFIFNLFLEIIAYITAFNFTFYTCDVTDEYIFCLLTVEMAILTRENCKTKTRILSANEVDALIAEHDRLEALAEQAKKDKQKL